MSPKPQAQTTDDKLDIIIGYLHRMDKRDRLRTIGGFFHGLISIIPVVVLLLSVWYVYVYGEDLLNVITKKASEQASQMMQENTEGFMNQIDLVFPGGGAH